MSALGELAERVARLYESMVTNTAEFNALRDQTREAVHEVKALVTRLGEEMRETRLEHVRERAALEAKIDALGQRLNVLSENALHSVIRDVARDLLREGAAEASSRPDLGGIRIAVLPKAEDAARSGR
jgi:hypothetical protein